MDNKKDTRLKVLSVIVAIVMWTFVINSTNPTQNKLFRSMPVVIKNQDDLEKSGYTIVGQEDKYTTNIRLKGSREKLINLKSENIYAYVDISNVREGVQSFPIEVDSPTGIAVDDVEPSQINLNIQEVLEKTLPVNLVIDEALRDGRIVDVNEMNPKEVTVKGPASVINNIDRAEAKIEEETLLDGKIHNVDIKIIDKIGKIVENPNSSHEDLNISFRVYETKRVPIKLVKSGSVDTAFEEVSATISPDSIVIKGPESVMRDIEEIQTKPVFLNGLKQTTTGEVKLDLPENIEVYNAENVVNYRIEVKKKPSPKSTSTTTNQNEDNGDDK